MKQLENFGLKLFTGEMAIEFDVLCVLVESLILNNVNSTLIVTLDICQLRMKHLKVAQHVEQPLNLTSSKGNGYIFCLARRSGD
ncbi:unnamed protein product [Linum trigynum]|uniref:Uncharacterized protein n=1 Tax=Linum trigynum TaxID=586398 RepID=A0AAV2GA77_9ROSI